MDNLSIKAMNQKSVRHVIAIALSAQSPHFVDVEKMPSVLETIKVNLF